MTEKWPKLVDNKTKLFKRQHRHRKKGLALHIGGVHIQHGVGFSFTSGMTLRTSSTVQPKIITVLHKDRISAPWDRDGVTNQLIYRSENMFEFNSGYCIMLRRDYWTGRCSLALLRDTGSKVVKYISFADQYFPPKRQRAKQRLLQRTFNRYLKLV